MPPFWIESVKLLASLIVLIVVASTWGASSEGSVIGLALAKAGKANIVSVRANMRSI